MQTLESIQTIVDQIKYKDWKIKIGTKGESIFLQIQFYDRDIYTKELTLQKCRKWTLSYFMEDNEIVRTAYKAIHTAVQHEVDETFTYKGVKIFHPHFNLDKLVDFVKDKNYIQIRDHIENEIKE